MILYPAKLRTVYYIQGLMKCILLSPFLKKEREYMLYHNEEVTTKGKNRGNWVIQGREEVKDIPQDDRCLSTLERKQHKALEEMFPRKKKLNGLIPDAFDHTEKMLQFFEELEGELLKGT